MARIRFFTDEHVARAVVIDLRRRGVDVLTVPEAGTLGASDAKQLQRASDEERVIFTQDDDFLRLAAAGTDHAGIVYATQERAVGQIIRGLMVKYRDVILPMTVLRRFDAVLEGSKQAVLDNFEFRNQIRRLSRADALGGHLDREVHLARHQPEPRPGAPRRRHGQSSRPRQPRHGHFEELVRRFNEENNEEAGEHRTPRGAVRLMAKLVFNKLKETGERSETAPPVIRTIHKPGTDGEFASILSDDTKHIEEDLAWTEDEDHSPAFEFRVNVDSMSGWPLFVKGRYNAAAGTLNYSLILKTKGRIYALDLGKDHHNPQCHQVGEMHKHSWSQRYRDKEAYVPTDVTAPVSDPVSVWKEFCIESGIQHNGRMDRPPAIQKELW